MIARCQTSVLPLKRFIQHHQIIRNTPWHESEITPENSAENLKHITTDTTNAIISFPPLSCSLLLGPRFCELEDEEKSGLHYRQRPIPASASFCSSLVLKNPVCSLS